jgi:hypothetical protein
MWGTTRWDMIWAFIKYYGVRFFWLALGSAIGIILHKLILE